MTLQTKARTATCALSLVFASSITLADETSDRIAAEALSSAAATLMSAGRYDEGCEKYQESQRLDPLPARMLQVGECNERRGRTASAWAAFSDARTTAEERGEARLAGEARQGVERIEANMARVEIVVPKSAELDGLEVRRDGHLLSRAIFSVAVPVDPGTHVIEATAPGHRPWATQIGIAPGRTAITVTVPVLDAAQLRPLPSSIAPNTPDARLDAGSSPNVDPGATQRTVGWVLGGAGLVGIAVGTVFALKSSATSRELDKICPDRTCPAEGAALVDQTRAQAMVADVSLGLGATSLAAGVLVYLLAPSAASAESKLGRFRVSPALETRAVGLVALGSF